MPGELAVWLYGINAGTLQWMYRPQGSTYSKLDGALSTVPPAVGPALMVTVTLPGTCAGARTTIALVELCKTVPFDPPKRTTGDSDNPRSEPESTTVDPPAVGPDVGLIVRTAGTGSPYCTVKAPCAGSYVDGYETTDPLCTMSSVVIVIGTAPSARTVVNVTEP